MKSVYVVGTCDTKEAELDYAKKAVESAGARAFLVDVGTRSNSRLADFSATDVANHHPRGAGAVLPGKDRGSAMSAMGEALKAFFASRDDIGGVLGLGGSGNTAIVTSAMRTLPVGVPKLMVSTMASGNTAPYVGPTDIAMMYSVVDIAGLNSISRKVIGNAAHAIAGMCTNEIGQFAGDKPALGLTMFGVTTPCVDQIRELVKERYDCYVFHATGTGGQSMEKLADSGLLAAVADVTTTEVADFLFGGVLPCTDDRFGAIIRTKLPYVGSVGAVDMVNFGAKESIPDKFKNRKLYVHNEQVTLMRTTPDENKAIGEWIVARLNQMSGPVRWLLPLGGVSAIDQAGQPFHDAEADEALFSAIRSGWSNSPNRKLIEVDSNINDPKFSAAIVSELTDVMR
jgi:uncharacterized protein (UPF0261 family)